MMFSGLNTIHQETRTNHLFKANQIRGRLDRRERKAMRESYWRKPSFVFSRARRRSELFFRLASFVFILRYQSSIPTIEHFSHRLLTTTTSFFIDRTIPYLIVRLKAVWLTLLTLVFCFAFAILFHWPKLQFDVCRITFDTLPGRSSCDIDALTKKTFDIDVSYYIGSKWEVPDDSWLIPHMDIPQMVYNEENKMTSIPGDLKTFDYALRTNLSQLIQFCASFKHPIEKRQVKYKQYHRHVLPQMISSQNSSPR